MTPGATQSPLAPAAIELSFGKAALIAATLFAAHQLVLWLTLQYLNKGMLDLCVFDCNWYGSVAAGYDDIPTGNEKKSAADWAFFPLFPLLVRGVQVVTGWSTQFALVLVSKLCFLAVIFVFIRYCHCLDRRFNPWLTGLVPAFNPYSFYADTGYSEALFLLMALLALQALENRRYGWAGVYGGLLSATRLVGGAFGFSFLVFVAQRWRSERQHWLDILLGLALVPLGLALFMAYLYFKTGDALAFSHIQVAWNRIPQNPLHYVNQLGLITAIPLLAVAVAIAALLYQRRYHLAVFSVLATLIPLTTGLWAMPRYVWWQAPLLLVVAQCLHYKKLWLPWLGAGIFCLVYFSSAWLRGEGWLL